MQETWVQSLGWEYPLEKEMAAHSSILAWRIPWTEDPGGLQSMGLFSCSVQTRMSQLLNCGGALATVPSCKDEYYSLVEETAHNL